MQKYIIILGPDEPFYLDGYDGTSFEWTPNRKVAWRMDYRKAMTYIAMMAEYCPEAYMEPV